MTATRWMAGWLLAMLAASAAMATGEPDITVEEILTRNAAARGGVEAWQHLTTMVWTGHVETGMHTGARLPFLLEQKRPSKTRFEVVNDGQRSIRMYDGRAGWKVRPNPANGRPELTPYGADEQAFARGVQVMDGPLMGAVNRRGVVTLSGHGEADGRQAYVLDVKLPSGTDHRIWIDAETFLEVRQDREVRDGTGRRGTVVTLFHDYREFEGVTLPTRIVTVAGTGAAQNTLVIERVALNPELDDGAFGRPDMPLSRKASLIVDTRGGRSPQVPAPALGP